MIDLYNVTKYYGKKATRVEALSSISIHIDEGEFIAITGKSGSGKSTLLNVLGSIDEFDTGTYLFDNEDIGKMSAAEKNRFRNANIGFIFQAFYLIPELTLLENVAMPLGYAGVNGKERSRRAMRLLGEVGLEEKANRYPSQISGGEQQRVAIARSLVNRPRLLLADEPTGNLDADNGIAIMELIRQFNTDGTTVVMATHDREFANCANRILHVKDGKLV